MCVYLRVYLNTYLHRLFLYGKKTADNPANPQHPAAVRPLAKPSPRRGRTSRRGTEVPAAAGGRPGPGKDTAEPPGTGGSPGCRLSGLLGDPERAGKSRPGGAVRYRAGPVAAVSEKLNYQPTYYALLQTGRAYSVFPSERSGPGRPRRADLDSPAALATQGGGGDPRRQPEGKKIKRRGRQKKPHEESRPERGRGIRQRRPSAAPSASGNVRSLLRGGEQRPPRAALCPRPLPGWR